MNIQKRIVEKKIEKRAYINGRYVDAIDKEIIQKTSSIDGSDLSGIASCKKEDVDIAVQAAKEAFESGIWSKTTHAHRKEVLLHLAALMEKNRETLALLDTYETGRAYKNYYEDSIPKAIEALRYFAESIDKYYDVSIPSDTTEFGIIKKVPLGVVGLITPWNDPMVVSAWKYGPALAMGNSVILKPAEQSSLSAIFLAGLTKEAGIPDGVFNVVPGYGETAGKALALHKDVRGIFFTGSSEVGKKIMTYAGESNMKKVGLECGGKGPYIVTESCKNVKESAKVLSDNMFYNQGQICSAPSRVIVSENKYDEFMKALKVECERYVPGDPFDDENNVGCVVSREQYNKIKKYIEEGVSSGADVYQATGEKKHHKDACCIKPTIISDIDATSKLAREEIFGPVVVVLKAKSTEDAISIANDSNYGLAGAIWTDDLNEAFYVANRVEVGLLHINSYGNDDNRSPFGGVKESGLGKDKSMYAFDEYSDLKSIWVHIKK
ncbi:MAG: aldehyde dehydrogenase family protein [Butyrivibrio sp.]|uniref:aldehyde dehydrogenase family protein n=1 Tax=Butyrivibrio sp. TaxID=28121 RepID=UPI0025F35E5A|nr:aldehyde dehydrogenase family protein [Butyrivibrio sp.]MCR5770690.1 aldehyde dehydrogenase family protein [Butyrivibrio sp.]